MIFIPARNPVSKAKERLRVSSDSKYLRIKGFASEFRYGNITAEQVPTEIKDDVMVYLLSHPKKKPELL